MLRDRWIFTSGRAFLQKNRQLTDIFACVSEVKFNSSLDCKTATASVSGTARQVSHYHLEFTNTKHQTGFLIKAIHMFGENDTIEAAPTKFTYSLPSPGWEQAQIPFPDRLNLAATDKVAAGYRFVHFAPSPAGSLDLLFSAKIAGKKVAYAFTNNGPASWGAGGQPWNAASKSINKSLPYDFEPPVSFVDEDGNDLGAILANMDGTGHTAIVQNNIIAGQTSNSAYLISPNSFEPHPEYRLPFVVSKDGKVVQIIVLLNGLEALGRI